ncbi:MAG: glycerol-3-phosphate dehydrogenase/oxidase [Isosphaeraceae bacterium]|nr:glycerol-3-phosphate dehydrogenase/oxidase [Isosphaeraceae bacterium]
MSRDALLARLRAGGTWDVLVIGGGATGLGTAVDAAARGYKTLLVEAHDYAKGTSSRSTKLIHGGVRYLAQGNVGLVREALHERGLLLRNAPHLVKRLGFVVPAYSWWAKPWYALGLAVYDRLAGQKGWGDSRPLSTGETLAHAPTLRVKGLRGGVLYYDGQFDDARLAIALLRTVLDLGGVALNALPVTGLIKRGGRIAGVEARDAETGESFRLIGRAVVNATGVFADAVRRLDDPSAPALLAPSQGAHVVLDRAFLPGDAAVLVPRTDDGRVLFAIPWHDRVLVGTTDTPVVRPTLEPRTLTQELTFLLGHAGRYLTRAPQREDVRSTFAGLRPLLGVKNGSSTAQLSREHSVSASSSGLVTVTGGKWTTYSKMGADAVDLASAIGGLPERASRTASLALHGAAEDAGQGSVYGCDAPSLERLIRQEAGGDAPLHSRFPYRAGEVLWAARHEQARTVEDVLARRTRALFLDAAASAECARTVAVLLAQELGRDRAWQDQQVRDYQSLALGYLPV